MRDGFVPSLIALVMNHDAIHGRLRRLLLETLTSCMRHGMQDVGDSVCNSRILPRGNASDRCSTEHHKATSVSVGVSVLALICLKPMNAMPSDANASAVTTMNPP